MGTMEGGGSKAAMTEMRRMPPPMPAMPASVDAKRDTAMRINSFIKQTIAFMYGFDK